MNLPSLLITFSAVVCAVFASIASDHECNRVCKVGETPKTCVYNFTVEWYRTLSKACVRCPFVEENCYRPHCVAADGHIRALLTINRQMPGPSIEVCEGDTVIVNVKNMLEDAATVTIHWHGLHQYKTPYMDGASHVTQCGIDVKETFRYEFQAKPAGTHWYHSHSGMQIADGVIGAFIVRKPKVIDPSGLLYENDLSDHVIMVNDWLPVIAVSRHIDQMHDNFDINLPIGSLINGRAKKFNVTSELDRSLPPKTTPIEVFHVNQNTSYRFRVICASTTCPMKLAIDGHQLTVIASDGMPVEPRTVSTMIIQPGERFDFVLRSTMPVGNYIVRFWGVSDCRFSNEMVYAMLRYNGSSHIFPEVDKSVSPTGQFLNPIPINNNQPIYTNGDLDIPVDELKSLRWDKVENYTDEVVDKVYYLAFDYNNNDNTVYNHPVYYPVKELPPIQAHFTPVIDNITFDLPPIPVLSQPEDIDPKWFCNRSSLSRNDCWTDLCVCTHLIHLKLNQVVDIILVNEGRTFTETGHPMHMHGHSFRLLGIEQLGESVSVSKVKALEERGELKRNLINPPWKDTVNVPDGSYVIIRLIADNPGYWFFHCHVDSHLLQGMAMLFKVGEDSDIPQRPEEFPRCGGMGFSNSRMTKCPSPSTRGPYVISSVKSSSQNMFLPLFAILFSTFVLFI